MQRSFAERVSQHSGFLKITEYSGPMLGSFSGRGSQERQQQMAIFEVLFYGAIKANTMRFR